MIGILSDNPALHNYWYVVARSADLTNAPASATLLNKKLVLWRDDKGIVNAAPDRCPHREAQLSTGTIEKGCLVCPYHGWTFESGGKCVRVPSSTQGVPPPSKAHLSTHHCTERYGLIWVCLGDPILEIPIISQETDPNYRRINTTVDVWKTSATRMTDNFLDITHFPWVHTGTFGRRQDTVVPKVDLQQLDESWFGYIYEVDANNTAGGVMVSNSTEAVVHRHMSSGFNLPFNVRSTISYASGLSHILLLISTPIDDVTSYFSFVVWRNDDFSVNAEEIIRFDLAIGAEDKRMLETVPGVLTLGQTGVVSVQADKCNVEWRRRLAEAMSI
jgi:phenylpropionate dioxygenase-like ring-hydroxylating dioxygenase large terminal subunit